MDARFVEIDHGSQLYRDERTLRNAILRVPLGMDLTHEDASWEEDARHFGMVIADDLIGCAIVLGDSDGQMRLKQMAVHERFQGKGVGAALICQIENAIRSAHAIDVVLHARETAVGFYRKLSYRTSGSSFMEIGVPHIKMMKELLPHDLR